MRIEPCPFPFYVPSPEVDSTGKSSFACVTCSTYQQCWVCIAILQDAPCTCRLTLRRCNDLQGCPQSAC